MGIFRDSPIDGEPPIIEEAPTRRKTRPVSFMGFGMKKSESETSLADTKEPLNKSDRFFTGLLGKIVGAKDGNRPDKQEKKSKMKLNGKGTPVLEEKPSLFSRRGMRNSISGTPLASPDSIFTVTPIQPSSSPSGNYIMSEPFMLKPFNLDERAEKVNYPELCRDSLSSYVDSPMARNASIEMTITTPLERTNRSPRGSSKQVQEGISEKSMHDSYDSLKQETNLKAKSKNSIFSSMASLNRTKK